MMYIGVEKMVEFDVVLGELFPCLQGLGNKLDSTKYVRYVQPVLLY